MCVCTTVCYLLLRGLSLLIVGGGPEDFWGATKFFSEILGGHQIFFRNFGGLPNYFPKFWGATKFFLSIYQKKNQILFYVYKSTHACYLMSLDVNFTIPFPVFPRPFPVFLNYASPNSHHLVNIPPSMFWFSMFQMMTSVVFHFGNGVYKHYFRLNFCATNESSDLEGFQPNPNDWYLDAKGFPLSF